MNKPIKSIISDFEQVILLITEARNRFYSKANAELVMLYFSVGQIVSEKVANGKWGDGTVDDLANYIAEKQPLLKGFNRRGLYRMKQFYEVYSDKEIVTTLLAQFQDADNEFGKFVTTVLTQIPWSSHLHILNKTKTIEEKLFYIHTSFALVRVLTNRNY